MYKSSLLVSEEVRLHRNKVQRDYRIAHPEKCRVINSKSCRKSSLKKKYGMTLEQYNEMFTAQNGVCYICKSPPKRYPLRVDHNHQTGQIRKLLCLNCNTYLHVLETPSVLKSLTIYLKEHEIK